MGFIQGVIDSDTIAHTDSSGHPAGRNLCVPAEASGRQLAKIVVKRRRSTRSSVISLRRSLSF